MKVRKPELAGHLLRMPVDRAVNKVFLGETDGWRGAARPKLRWFDYSENDLKSMGVKIWRNKAEDRSVWDVILRRHSLNYKELIPMKTRSKFFPSHEFPAVSILSQTILRAIKRVWFPKNQML